MMAADDMMRCSINDKSFIYDGTRDDSVATFNFRFGNIHSTESLFIYHTHCCTNVSVSYLVLTITHQPSNSHTHAQYTRRQIGQKSFQDELLYISFRFSSSSFDIRSFAFNGVAAASKHTLEH